MPRGIKISRNKFAKALIKTGGNQKQAYKLVNPKISDKVAEVEGGRVANEPVVKSEVIKALDKAGFTQNKVADNLSIAMQAGLGRKATNRDAIKVLELALKYHAQAEGLEEYDPDYIDMEDKELITELKKMNKKIDLITKGHTEEGEVVEEN